MRTVTGSAAASARPPRRFRRRLLLVLLLAGVGPLLAWGLAGRSLLEGALSVAPPVGPLLGRAADELEGGRADPALAGELRAAELHLAQANLARRRLLERTPLWFLLALGVSVALVAVAAALLGRRLSRPVEQLAGAMARYGRGDFGHEVALTGRGDELDYLGAELNRMGRELLAQRERLQTTEVLAAWRDVARAMAHDLKNPLTAMRMALGRLARPDRSPEAAGEAVSLLQDQLDVLIKMTQSFSDFARLPAPAPRPLDLAALLEEIAALYQAEARDGGIVVRAQVRPTIVGDADQLRRAFGNLLKNALEASAPGDGPVEIVFAGPSPGEGGGPVRVTVRDRGAGIAAALEGGDLVKGLGSTKAAGRGLGLPIAHKIIHDHGGRLRLAPAPPRGTEAVVELPISAARGEAHT
jgi:two-component system, NtrC family, nitrogen regulation sensor histidine kinase NtrY